MVLSAELPSCAATMRPKRDAEGTQNLWVVIGDEDLHPGSSGISRRTPAPSIAGLIASECGRAVIVVTARKDDC